MKEYIIKRAYEPKHDLTAFVWQNKNSKWQIYTKERCQPISARKLYVDFFGGVYDLNKPKNTKEEAEEHLYLQHLLRNWIDPSCDKFYEIVAMAIVDRAAVKGFNIIKYPSGREKIIAPEGNWEKFFKDIGVARTEWRLDRLAEFAERKINITPYLSDMNIRHFYFHLCKVLNFSPYAAGFWEGLIRNAKC